MTVFLTTLHRSPINLLFRNIFYIVKYKFHLIFILLFSFIQVFYKDVFAKHADLFAQLKVNPNNGLGDVYDKIKGHPAEAEVKADIEKQYETRPNLAMVDSNNGITNLHVPSDVIIDASMPNVVRIYNFLIS